MAVLIADKQSQTHECSHKLAAEMLSGLIRGSKYWPFSQLADLWANLKPLLDSLMENLTTETLKLWFTCFSNAFEDQDPRRLTFYLNYFGELARKMLFRGKEDKDDFVIVNSAVVDAASPSSFQQTSCLNLLGAFSQLEWRAQLFWSNLADLLQANMSHPYKAIREKIGACLTLYYVNEIDYSLGINPTAVKSASFSSSSCSQLAKQLRMENLAKFIDFLIQRLTQSIELFEYIKEENIDDGTVNLIPAAMDTSKSAQHMSAVAFLHTIFSFFGYYMIRCYQPMNHQLLRLVPLLCSIDKIAAQDSIIKVQLPLIRLSYTMWMLGDQDATYLIEQIRSVNIINKFFFNFN